MRDLAEAVAEAIPGTKVSLNAAAPPDKRSYLVDFSLYRQLAPDHQPQRTLADTLVELRDGLNGINFRDAEFRSSELMRLRVISRLRETGQLTDSLTWATALPHTQDSFATSVLQAATV